MSFYRRSQIEDVLKDRGQFSDEYSKQMEIERLCPDAGYEIRNSINMGYDIEDAARRIDQAQERREEAEREERAREREAEMEQARHEAHEAEMAAAAEAEEMDRAAYEAQQAEEENARYEAEQEQPPDEEIPI